LSTQYNATCGCEDPRERMAALLVFHALLLGSSNETRLQPTSAVANSSRAAVNSSSSSVRTGGSRASDDGSILDQKNSSRSTPTWKGWPAAACARAWNATSVAAHSFTSRTVAPNAARARRGAARLAARAKAEVVQLAADAAHEAIALSRNAADVVTMGAKRRRASLEALARRLWRRDRAVSRVLRQAKARQWYKVLRVRRKADKKELKVAYRTIAKRVHPDKTRDDRAELAFNTVRDAYELLSDARQRARFDNELAQMDEQARLHRERQRAKAAQAAVRVLRSAMRLAHRLMVWSWEEAQENPRVAIAIATVVAARLLMV
jgi:hypothetical protein